MLSKRFGNILVFMAIAIVSAASAGCSRAAESGKPKITVTILPLKYVVQQIVGDDFDVAVLVPPGQSIETFEPTPQQMKDLDGSVFVFTTGLLDFELELQRKLVGMQANAFSIGGRVNLIEGDGEHGDGHNHGVDPHIWLSPGNLLSISATMHMALHRVYPDSLKYHDNLRAFNELVIQADSSIRAICGSAEQKSFVIYHPALAYYARDYGLNQLALEEDGKEPSAAKMAALVRQIDELGISKILYQKQVNSSIVEALAGETGARVVEFDPLSEDVLNNLINVTTIITSR